MGRASFLPLGSAGLPRVTTREGRARSRSGADRSLELGPGVGRRRSKPVPPRPLPDGRRQGGHAARIGGRSRCSALGRVPGLWFLGPGSLGPGSLGLAAGVAAVRGESCPRGRSLLRRRRWLVQRRPCGGPDRGALVTVSDQVGLPRPGRCRLATVQGASVWGAAGDEPGGRSLGSSGGGSDGRCSLAKRRTPPIGDQRDVSHLRT